MRLCLECIQGIIKELTPNDIYVLNDLQDKRTAQTGVSKNELFEGLKETMSIFQLQQALMRLDLVGLIDVQKQGRIMHYHITSEGLVVLEMLKNN